MIEFRHLEVFRAVMQTGSFTKAARKLRSSQPTVSRMIAELQSEVGFRLFLRRGAAIEPTPEAVDLFHVVDRSFLGIDTIAREASSIAGRRTSYLRVVSLPALALTFLPQVIASFQRSRPGINISIDVQRSEAIAGWSAIESFDVGFSMLPIHRSGLNIQTFLSAPAVCLMPEGHPLASLEVVTPGDLDGVGMISSGPFSFGAQQQRFEQIMAEVNARYVIKAETPLTAVACELVVQGVGVAIVDRFVAESFRGRGVIMRRFLPEVMFNYGVFMPHSSVPHQLASAFIAESFALQREWLQSPL